VFALLWISCGEVSLFKAFNFMRATLRLRDEGRCWQKGE